MIVVGVVGMSLSMLGSASPRWSQLVIGVKYMVEVGYVHHLFSQGAR